MLIIKTAKAKEFSLNLASQSGKYKAVKININTLFINL